MFFVLFLFKKKVKLFWMNAREVSSLGTFLSIPVMLLFIFLRMLSTEFRPSCSSLGALLVMTGHKSNLVIIIFYCASLD